MNLPAFRGLFDGGRVQGFVLLNDIARSKLTTGPISRRFAHG